MRNTRIRNTLLQGGCIYIYIVHEQVIRFDHLHCMSRFCKRIYLILPVYKLKCKICLKYPSWLLGADTLYRFRKSFIKSYSLQCFEKSFVHKSVQLFLFPFFIVSQTRLKSIKYHVIVSNIPLKRVPIQLSKYLPGIL